MDAVFPSSIEPVMLACIAPHDHVRKHDARNEQERDQEKDYKTLQGLDEDLSFGFLVLRIGGFALYDRYDNEHKEQDHAHQKHAQKGVPYRRRSYKVRQNFFFAAVDFYRFNARKFAEYVPYEVEQIAD